MASPPSAPFSAQQPSSRSSGNKPRPVLVYYHIPSDHDDADHPNAFPLFRASTSNAISDSAAIRLKDIKRRFPLPGNYHFRFKVKLESSFFWIDVVNDDSVIPQYNNKIIAKVLRVDWNPPTFSHLPAACSPTTQRDSDYPSSSSPAPVSGIGGSLPPHPTIDDMLFLDSPSTSAPDRNSNPPPTSRSTHPPSNATNGLDDFFG